MQMNLNFTPKDWERIKLDWTAWWHHELDRPMVVFDVYEWQGISFIPQFAGWDVANYTYPIERVLDYYQNIFAKAKYYGDSWPRWWPNFGAGIIAGFLGARVFSDQNTVWFEPEQTLNVGDIHPKFDTNNFWWRWVKEITLAATNRWGNQITVATTDLGGNLDILASLRGTQNLLIDLYDAPEEVNRVVAEITRLWLQYYDTLYEIIRTSNNGTTSWAPMWCPGRYYMLQSDFCYMISPEMFERFVLPDLEACCNHLDYGFYHLDGKGQIPHLDMLLAIKNLRGIQWIPGDGAPPPEQWLPLLKRIRDADKLCQVYISAEGAMTIARELGGAGFTFMIIDFLPEEEITGLLKALGADS